MVSDVPFRRFVIRSAKQTVISDFLRMKQTATWSLVFLFSLANTGMSRAAPVPEERIDQFYQELNTNYGNGLTPINTDFEKSFPESDQADVLAEIIERSATTPGNINVLSNAMYFAETFVRPDGSKPWNQRLQAALLAQAQNSNPRVRSRLAGFLISRHENEFRKRILSFLKDDDNEVRQDVINGIIKDHWPDALEICRQYILRNGSIPNYRGSIICAKRYTNPQDVKRSNEIAQAMEQPNAQKTFESYIAAHNDDPAYEVSVYTAKQFLKSIPDNAAFEASITEEKKRADLLHELVLKIESGAPPEYRAFPDQLNFLYWLFDTKDPSTSQYACRYFVDAIPREDRVALLTSMADRATRLPVDNDVLKNILVATEFQPQMSQKDKIWSGKLESLIWDQRNNSDRIIRSYVVRVLAGWNPNQYRTQILFFLEDKDPFVRETCVDAIYHWPDSKEIYQSFKEKHRSDPTYQSTLFAIQELSDR